MRPHHNVEHKSDDDEFGATNLLVVVDISTINFDDDNAVVGKVGGGRNNGEREEDSRGGVSASNP